jgi:hypothetical protein
MNKTLLRQALKFKDGSPTFSQTKQLNIAIKKYEQETQKRFSKIRYGQRSKILNLEQFFSFLSEVANDNRPIHSFEEIEEILTPSNSRQENIRKSGNSKNSYIGVFNNIVIFAKLGERPKLYKNYESIPLEDSPILAIENGESFLNIENFATKFGFGQYLYLGGMSNKATREFLKDKDVIFFLDYDIEAIRIYNSFQCRSKSFFRHPEIESFFANSQIKNEKLYRKQLYALENEDDELQWLINLIKKYGTVVEQEIFL